MNRNKFYLPVRLLRSGGLFSLLLSLTYFSKAQENLAYTRYGIGELKSQSFSSVKGFGEIYSAYNGPSDYDINNPASLGFLKLTTFQMGGFGNVSWMESRTSKASFGNVSFDYLSVGFPVIKKYWGASIGLSQFSRASFDVFQESNSASLGLTRNTFNGSGGFNQFYLANGIKLKNFSVGVKVGYMFGTIRYENTLEYPDIAYAYNTLEQENRKAGDLFWNGGIQYNVAVSKKNQLCIGVDGNLSTRLNTSREILNARFINNDLGNGVIKHNIIDTISMNTEQDFVIIPMQLNGGIIFKQENRFMTGIQFHYGQWKDYRSFGVQDVTTNNWEVSIGGEWVPDSKSIDGYFNRVKYRLGAYYGTNYIRLSGNDLKSYGATIGFGFPIRHSSSLLNMAFDFGQAGNVKDNLLKQTYLKGTVGFSLCDIWFLKRKYD